MVLVPWLRSVGPVVAVHPCGFPGCLSTRVLLACWGRCRVPCVSSGRTDLLESNSVASCCIFVCLSGLNFPSPVECPTIADLLDACGRVVHTLCPCPYQQLESPTTCHICGIWCLASLDLSKSSCCSLMYARPHCGVIVPGIGLLSGLVIGRQVGKLGVFELERACGFFSEKGPVTRESSE